MKAIKNVLVLFLLGILTHSSSAQNFNDQRTSISNFLKRMYINSPFDGVKVVEDYDNKYFISVVCLEKAKYTSVSIMNRVAQTKAQSQANTFFNGSTVSSDLVIKTNETRSKDSSSTTITTIESIKEKE